jgi:hypothetical protein
MRALALVVCAGCFGTLGQPGHRAPPGLAFCEPTTIELSFDDARTIRATCDAGGVHVLDSDGYAATAYPLDASRLWDAAGELAPSPACDGAGARYQFTLYGDDGRVDRVACTLGSVDAFDRALGALLIVRHPPPVRWMDIVAVSSR